MNTYKIHKYNKEYSYKASDPLDAVKMWIEQVNAENEEKVSDICVVDLVRCSDEGEESIRVGKFYEMLNIQSSASVNLESEYA